MIAVDDLQQDVINEWLNLGMGHAAASLSQMVGDEVLLSVPTVKFCSRQVAIDHIDIGGNIKIDHSQAIQARQQRPGLLGRVVCHLDR